MPADPRDFKLELSSLPDAEPTKPLDVVKPEGRDFLRVLFACCNVYRRVEVPRGRERFDARCPRCLRPIVFRVAPGGSDDRSFIVE